MLNNENIHQVFRSIPQPILLLEPRDSGYFIVEVNDQYLKQTGTRRQALLGKSLLGHFPEYLALDAKAAALIKDALEKVEKNGEPSTIDKIRHEHPVEGTGEIRTHYWQVENVPVKNDDGQVAYILYMIRDITEEVEIRRRQEEKNQKQELLSNFIEENVDALFSLDREGNFTSANKKLADSAEVSMEKLLQLNFIRFCDPEEQPRIIRNFETTLSGQATKFEANFQSLQGKKMVLKISMMPVKIGNRIEGVYGIAKDITGLRQTERIVVEKKNFLEVNTAFINALLERELDYDLLEKGFSLIAKAVSADRIGYFEATSNPESDEVIFKRKADWNNPHTAPERGATSLQGLSPKKTRQLLAPLFQNRPISAIVSKLQDREMKEIFQDHRIKSVLVLPLWSKNQLFGFISIEDCTQERLWSEEELPFLTGLANNLTNALEKRSTERIVKDREEQLRKNEQKFRALVQEGSDLMAILDVEGKYTFASATIHKALGIYPEEILGKEVFQFVHPEDREQLRKQFQELTYGYKKKVPPFRYSDSKGNWLWMETTATNLLHDPAVQGIVTNSRDVTTLMEQAREIEHINERYRLAATATQDIIYDWDLIEDWVQRYHDSPKKLFGYSEAEVGKGKFWRTHIHPSDAKQAQDQLQVALHDPQENFITTEYRFRRADGSYALVVDRGYILRDSNGKAIRLVGATSDISDIKAKEDALRIANERFALAMDATNEMIYDWDMETNVIVRNQAFEEIYGYAPEEYPDPTFWLSQIVEEDRERVQASLKKAMETEDHWREEYAVYKADGSIVQVIDRSSLLRGPEGKVKRIVGAVLDVSQSLRLLNEVQKQNRTLREIAWEQSHVVRAPLSRLKGLIYLLELQGFEKTEQKKVIEHITSSADELDEILRRIVAKTEELGDENI